MRSPRRGRRRRRRRSAATPPVVEPAQDASARRRRRRSRQRPAASDVDRGAAERRRRSSARVTTGPSIAARRRLSRACRNKTATAVEEHTNHAKRMRSRSHAASLLDTLEARRWAADGDRTGRRKFVLATRDRQGATVPRLAGSLAWPSQTRARARCRSPAPPNTCMDTDPALRRKHCGRR